MESAFSTNAIKAYLKVNWMKVSLLLILCFVFLKKDLSFEFNLNSPLKVEEPVNEEMVLPKSKEAEERPTVITEKFDKKKEKEKVVKGSSAGFFDSFEIPFFGKKKEKMPVHAEHGEIDELVMDAYVKRFGHVAISEKKKYGIPASIILANALFHSFAGQRDMVLTGNNHFAIPCGRNWNGDRSKYQGTCYRHYDNAWASFRDHSLFITHGAFQHLLSLGTENYKAWAKGLEKAKYSERRNLAKNLISLIEEYKLDEYDY